MMQNKEEIKQKVSDRVDIVEVYQVKQEDEQIQFKKVTSPEDIKRAKKEFKNIKEIKPITGKKFISTDVH